MRCATHAGAQSRYSISENLRSLSGCKGVEVPEGGRFLRAAGGRGVLGTALIWVREAGQTGTVPRHSTQNRQKCRDTHSPFQSTVHRKEQFPTSQDNPPHCPPQGTPRVPQD